MTSSRDPLEPDLLTDELVRAVSRDGSVTARAIVGTEIVREAQRLQHLGPTAVTALGRALLGTVLVAAGAQQEETVQIQFRGDGSLGTMLAIAEQDGRVRGTVSNPAAGGEAEPRDDRSSVSAAVGRGILAVVRSHPRSKEPYRGVIPLDSGEVALDIARYLTDSEQTPSALGLGVALDDSGHVAAAGGFLVQALPGADDDILARVEANVRNIASTARLVRDGADANAIVERVLEGVGAGALHRSTPRFDCPCTRERVLRTVVLLGRKELSEIIANREELEIGCEFCGEHYQLDPNELGTLLPDA